MPSFSQPRVPLLPAPSSCCTPQEPVSCPYTPPQRGPTSSPPHHFQSALSTDADDALCNLPRQPQSASHYRSCSDVAELSARQHHNHTCALLRLSGAGAVP